MAKISSEDLKGRGHGLRIMAFSSYPYPWKLGLISRLESCGAQVRLFYFTDKGAYGVYQFVKTANRNYVRLARIQLLQGRVDIPNPGAFLTLLRSVKCHIFLDIDSMFDVVQILLSLLQKARGALVVRILSENRETRLRGSPVLVMLWHVKRSIKRIGMKFSDLVIVESKASAEVAVRMGAVPDRIVQMTHGVDLAVFQANNPHSRSFDKAAECPLTVLYLGGFLRHKGIEYLVKAIESRQLDSMNFVIASFGPSLSDYKPRLEKLNNVKFVLPVAHDKLPALYSTSDIVIVPSITTEIDCERSPNVVLEAMGMGRVVVASRIGGVPDVLGDAGVYIQERSEGAIITALTNLDRHRNILVEFMAKSRLRAVKMFDADRYAQLVFRSITACWQARQTGMQVRGITRNAASDHQDVLLEKT
jgi:glycosyltransferase involved in cell wall biosynthesis